MSVHPPPLHRILRAMYSSLCGLPYLSLSSSTVSYSVPNGLLYDGPLYIPPLSTQHVHCFHSPSYNSMDKAKVLKIGLLL